MHELSLCEHLRDILEEQARTRAFSRITRVQLEIGPLSCIEPEAMQFGFDAVMQGGIAEGATLDIIRSAIEGFCLGCEQHVQLDNRFDDCPNCGSPDVHASGGDALRIKLLEVI